MKTLLKVISIVGAAGIILATQAGCGGTEKGKEPPNSMVAVWR